MRVVLVDDHPVVRKGLKALLEEQSAFRVVGEASDGAEAVAIIKKLKPDVAILDLKLPDMNGLQVTAEVKRQSPATRVIILSMHANDFYVDEAFRKGADGYVVKDALEREIIEAITHVTSGGRYLSEMLSSSLVATRIERHTGVEKDHFHGLTNREREIFCLIAQGHFNKAIAMQLDISVRTVETHRANIMRKLSLHTPSELIHYAVSRKIVELP
jgi:two-component system, NarL family, response regulator NreC